MNEPCWPDNADYPDTARTPPSPAPELQDIQRTLGLSQPLCTELFLNLLILQEIDPLIQSVLGNIVKAVDLNKIIFRKNLRQFFFS